MEGPHSLEIQYPLKMYSGEQSEPGRFLLVKKMSGRKLLKFDEAPSGPYHLGEGGRVKS